MVFMLALRIDDMLRPVTGHRIAALRDRELDEPVQGISNILERYEVRYRESRRCSQLGLIGSAGFVALLAIALSWPIRGLRSLGTLRDLAQLNVAVLILGLNGGLGELIASLSSERIRAYDRMSILIMFFALFALALLLDRLTRHRRRGLGFWLVLGTMVGLGLLDQIPLVITPQPAVEKAAFASDREFVRQIESSLPEGSMVFQLPPNSFPEFGGHFTMSDYNLFRGYFHSKDLRWSYGAMRGREVEKWQSSLAPLPPRKLIAQLKAKGFAGLYVNRRGHVNNATALEGELESLLRQKPLVSADRELAFFRLDQ
jgi:phosphoglycerol transferase